MPVSRCLTAAEVEAASLLPPQIAMAEQLGLRKIIEDTFHTLWWVPEGFDPEHTKAYLRALDRAEKAMDANLAWHPLAVERSWPNSRPPRGTSQF